MLYIAATDSLSLVRLAASAGMRTAPVPAQIAVGDAISVASRSPQNKRLEEGEQQSMVVGGIEIVSPVIVRA